MIGPVALAALAQEGQYWALGGVLVAAAAIEAWRPDRSRLLPRGTRWVTNLGLHGLNELLFRFVAPYTLALWLLATLGTPHFGAFATIDRVGGPWATLVASLLMLDLLTYLLHRLEHAVFPLWRLHAIHHADIDVDVTTAVRHHPIEAILTGIAYLAVVILLGMPLWALPVYAVLGLAVQLSQHANVRLPARIEAALGLVLMTPGLHRTHHASAPAYYNTNFGTVLSVWDRSLFTLAPPLPEANPPGFGVASFLEARFAKPHWALLMPFVLRRPRGGVAAPAERRSAAE